MLRIITNVSAAGAKSYYSSADYYSEGQELQGQWRGRLAERLGLSGLIDKADWDALCDNRDPHSGRQLTPRVKTVRRVGYDLNFHAPKSLSLLYSLTKDERLLGAFQEAVNITMTELERDMQARVRLKGRNEDRVTGSMLWGEFTHFTARPVGGVPDPHLHAHAFAFNLTFDDHEQRYKAGQFGAIKRDAPYFEAVFHSHLARRIEQLGLRTERTRTGWEIAGVPSTATEKFSRRTAQIEAKAKALGIDSDKDKDTLGAKTRERKSKTLSMDQLRELWRSRLSTEEADALNRLEERVGAAPISEDDRSGREAVRSAIGHCFERSAVVPERTIVTRALKHSVGKASTETVTDALQDHALIRRSREHRWLVTTKEVLAEEQRMLDFARSGKASCRQLGSPSHAFKHPSLTSDQKKAVLHVLTSKDRVIAVRGAAGTGKTTMMQEAVAGIEAGPGGELPGKRVFTFAPSASASRGVLRNEGFESADTVARLLVDHDLQEECRDQVLWIDEAGLLGSRAMATLFDLAKSINARVILSGDHRQHGSVERGGVLKLLETDAGIAPVELREIKRQTGLYKSAVSDLSEGRIADGFAKLDELGWIKEIGAGAEGASSKAEGDDLRYRAMAEAYVESVQQPGQTLVVSPTHAESDRITREIRAALKAQNLLPTADREVTALRPVPLTEAERADPLSYQPGDVLVFHQNAKGISRGARIVVEEKAKALPLDQHKRFTVYRPSVLHLAKGDRVRITKNVAAKDDAKRLNNGDLHTVTSIANNGTVTLENGAELPAGFGFLDYGYCSTSHASQGKSVDRVIVGQSSASFPASSMEQFYVSVSRGKKSAMIFTDDHAALLEAVSHVDRRQTATDFVLDREAEREERSVPQAVSTRGTRPTVRPSKPQHRRPLASFSVPMPPDPERSDPHRERERASRER